MKLSRMAGLVLMALTAACTEKSQPLAIPDLADIESMYVFRRADDGTDWAYETTDRKRIGAILAHLRDHNSGYRIETSLYVRLWNPAPPDSDYQVLFMAPTDLPLGFEVGPDWLGGKDDLVKFPESERRRNLARERPLGAEERAALVALLEPQPLGGNLRFIHGPLAE